LRIPGREGRRRKAYLRQGVLEVSCDALAVSLLVVQDEHLLRAELFREQGVSRALEVVRRDDTDVVPRSGRVVLVRLARCGSGTRVRQTDVRVRRADHADRA